MARQFTNNILAQGSLFLCLLVTTSISSLSAAEICDADGNGTVSREDINLILQARGRTPTRPFEPLDIDRNGTINSNDARQCVCKLTIPDTCTADLNQNPIANPGSDQSITLIIFAAIFLDGSASTDPDSDSLNYAWVFQQRPRNSQAVLIEVDTPTPSFVPDVPGIYIIRLTTSDGFDGSHSDTVTVTVRTPPNLVAIADTSTTRQGDEAISGNVIDNDALDNTAVLVTEIAHNGQLFTPGTPFTTDAGARLQLQANGNYTYIPPLNALETAVDEVFTYTITETGLATGGVSSRNTLTIRLIPENKLPLAADDKATAEAGAANISGNVMDNDDLGDTPTKVIPIGPLTTANGGAFTLFVDGSYSYTPAASLSGIVEEPFTYTLQDDDGEISNATLTIIVNPNTPPLEAKPDTRATKASAVAITGNLLEDDNLGNTPTQVVLLTDDNNQILPLGETYFTSHGGEFSLLEDGRYSYVMLNAEAIDGVIKEVFTYTIEDSDNKTSTAILTISVFPLGSSPLARPDVNNATVGGLPVTANVLVNDDQGIQPASVAPISITASQFGGAFELQADGNYVYTPPTELSGVVQEIFTYTLTDQGNEKSQASVTITVNLIENPTPGKDPLEACIRKRLRLTSSDPLTSQQLSSITTLHCANKGITDISILSELTELAWLDLDFNRLTDISPLSNLTGLTWVVLYGNQITDISPLSNLTALAQLNIGANQLTDITALSNLTALRQLELSRNHITDFTPIDHVANVTGQDSQTPAP